MKNERGLLFDRIGQMRIARGACAQCGGDVYMDYKRNRPGGPYPKCVQCGRIQPQLRRR